MLKKYVVPYRVPNPRSGSEVHIYYYYSVFASSPSEGEMRNLRIFKIIWKNMKIEDGLHSEISSRSLAISIHLAIKHIC